MRHWLFLLRSRDHGARGAFTLVEILVVLGITAALAGLVLTYTSASRDQVAMYVEEAKLAQTVSRAKALAITTFDQPGGRNEIPCGYGVHFDYASQPQTYTLFSYKVQDCAIVNALDLSDLASGQCTSDSKACTIASAILPKNVALVASGEDPIENVLFIPPDPKTWVWYQGADATSTTGAGHIYLAAAKISVKVFVGQGGQITF
jgi:type II secretory pathway pseudopilin PulG